MRHHSERLDGRSKAMSIEKLNVRVTHLVTYPRNVDPRREAVAQDVAALRLALQPSSSAVHHISPWEAARRVYPERLFGLGLWPRARTLNTTTDLFHIWHWPREFVFLRGLRKPILFTANAGLSPTLAGRAAALLRSRPNVGIVVSSPRDKTTLAAALEPAHVDPSQAVTFIRPGIDLAKFPLQTEWPFSPAAAPDQPFYLLCASAPWQPADFVRKGIDALLAAAQAVPQLHLTFLWRDLLMAEMERRVAQAGLGARVRVVNALANVSAELLHTHAAVLLASDSSIVKAYPNSLLEAVCSGRPVLISRQIALSDDVTALGCGVVVDDVNPAAVQKGVRDLMAGHAGFAAAARAVPRITFDRARWQSEYLARYASLLAARP